MVYSKTNVKRSGVFSKGMWKKCSFIKKNATAGNLESYSSVFIVPWVGCCALDSYSSFRCLFNMKVDVENIYQCMNNANVDRFAIYLNGIINFLTLLVTLNSVE